MMVVVVMMVVIKDSIDVDANHRRRRIYLPTICWLPSCPLHDANTRLYRIRYGFTAVI